MVLHDTKLLDRQVYKYLVMDSRCPRTLSQVAAIMGRPKSTVHKSIQRLVEGKYVKKLDSSKTNILYRKWKNSRVIEGYISLDDLNCTYNQVDTRAVSAERRVVRTHLNGGFVVIDVLEKGQMDNIQFKLDGLSSNYETFRLFCKQSRMKGMDVHHAHIINNGDRYRLQLLVSDKTGKMTLKIAPPHVQQTVEEARDDIEQKRDPFYRVVKPLLDFLEKWGRWVFDKDKDGNYNVRCNSNREYGLDVAITAEAKEVFNDSLGVPGLTPYWIDNSPGAMGSDGELESNDVESIEALMRLPQTTAEVHAVRKELNELKEEVEKMKEKRRENND